MQRRRHGVGFASERRNMKGRLWLSGAMAALGTCLLLAAAMAGSAAGGNERSDGSERRGGTWRIVLTSDFDHWDPALAYFTHSWNMGLATQLRMYYYPMVSDRRNQRVQPMAARGFPRISNRGRRYTIQIKRGFRFSNGAAVTAHNFARALQRGKNNALQSPASSFLDDVRGWRVVRNYTLVINLRVVAPDFLARLTMPFFSAVHGSVPVNAEPTSAPYHSAGPYYLVEWTKGQSARAIRNPHWNRNTQPRRSLGIPANIDQITWRVVPSLATQRLMCDRDEADICGAPTAQYDEIARAHGINRTGGRFHVRPDLLVWRIDMNNDQPLFRNNARLRRAVNHALNRGFMVAQHGAFAGRITDQFLPYGMPGFREARVYPAVNLTRARALAQGQTRSGRAIMYTFNVGQGPAIAQSVQFQLNQIGINVEVRQFTRVVQNTRAATRGEPFDMTVEGWHADYPDPANFINVLLDGRRIQAENNVNTSYYRGQGTPRFYAKLDRAYRTAGSSRLRQYGALDAEMMRTGAPSAPYISGNIRNFLSPSAGCYGYSPQTGHILVQVCKR
jgi:peptide/nickel transport system substrate-binding protein